MKGLEGKKDVEDLKGMGGWKRRCGHKCEGLKVVGWRGVKIKEGRGHRNGQGEAERAGQGQGKVLECKAV